MRRILPFPARWLAALGALILLAGLLPGRAEAHAHLIQADPAADATLTRAPTVGRFWFDEDLNGVLSRIVILDSANHQVNADTGHLAPGATRELVVALPHLADGRYTVEWTSDSAQDGHILHGFYSFAVGTGSGAGFAAAPAAGSVSQPSLDGTVLAQIGSRWLSLLALTLWTGLLVVGLAVLWPAARRPAGSPVAALAALAVPRAEALLRGALLVLLVSLWLELAVQALSATSGDVRQALSPPILRGLLVGTSYGTLWLVRLAVLLVALLVSLLTTEPAVAEPEAEADEAAHAAGIGHPAHRETTTVMSVIAPLPVGLSSAGPLLRTQISAALALAFLVALALSGHAATVPSNVQLSVAVDVLHLVTTAGWLGGIVGLVVLVVPCLRHLPARAREEALIFSVDHFSPVAATCVAVLAASGLYNALQRIVAPSELLTTTYGQALVVKLLLVGTMVLVSASHVFGIRRRLRRLRAGLASWPGTSEVEAEAHQLVGLLIGRLQVEPFLGAGVLLCVSVMVATLPSQPLPATGGPAAANATLQATLPLPASSLRVTLRATPGQLGRNVFTATLLRPDAKGKLQPDGDGQIRLKVVMPAMATMGSTFAETTMIGEGQYRGAADIVMGGDWQIDVLVRTPDDPLDFRDVTFRLTAGLYGQPPQLAPWTN